MPSKEAGFPKPRIEGEDNGEWIIVDCGSAVAHIMQPAIRQYYRLEELWGDTPVRLKLGAAKPSSTAAADLADKSLPRRPPSRMRKLQPKGSGQKRPLPLQARPLWQGHGEGCGKDCCQSCTPKLRPPNRQPKTGCKTPLPNLPAKPLALPPPKPRSRQDSREDRGRQPAGARSLQPKKSPAAKALHAQLPSLLPKAAPRLQPNPLPRRHRPAGLMALPLRTHRVGAQCVGISHSG